LNIIVAGDGKVGSMLTKQLASEDHDITVIDIDDKVLRTSAEKYDVMAVKGNCAAMSVLLQAGVERADLLIATSNADEINLLCCMTAHGINPKIHTIARIRNPEYIDQIYKMRDVFALSLAINPEKQAAIEIERLLKFPGFLRRESFAKGKAEIVELRIEEGSKLCDVSLYALNGIVKCRVLVCAVLRNGEVIVPNGNLVLREGDRIFVTAPTHDLATLLKNLGIISRRVKHTILCGGGGIAYYLAKMLVENGIAVKLIERDERRCRELCEQLPKVDVICGDATDRDLMISEGVEQTDALVTLTDVDEFNMIVSLFGDNLHVPQVITKLGHMGNMSLVDTLSLDGAICPQELCCNTIVHYVRAMENQSGAALSVHLIADGQVEAIEFRVDADSEHCDEPLKTIALKENILIVSITHGPNTTIPNGDSMFHHGDTVVVVNNGRGVVRQFNDIFA